MSTSIDPSLFRKMVEFSEEGMCFADEKGRILFVNQKACELWGRAEGEILGHSVSEFLDEKSAESFIAARSRRKAGAREQYELTFTKADGSLVYTITYASPIFDENGVFIGALGTVADITPRRRAEDELKEREAQLAEAQQISQIGSFELFLDSQQMAFSSEGRRILGIPQSQSTLSFAEFLSLLHPSGHEIWKQSVLAVLQDSSGRQMDLPVQSHKGLMIIAVNIKGHPNSIKRATVIGTLHDVTQREADKKAMAEQQLRSIASSKMAALGEMAGGVAHEINNPLAIIQMRAEQLLERMQAGRLEPVYFNESVSTIIKTTHRIAKIVQGLRSFCQDGSRDAFQPVKVQKLLDETVSLCAERFKLHDVQLRINHFDPSVSFEGRPTEISQVLLNLLNNAHDAILGTEDKWVEIAVQDRGADIEIHVTDSGFGIPESIRSKIFQPFFTTKELGKGTGLGLSISLGIVQDHCGDLRVDPQHSNTCFVMRLPKFQDLQIQSG